MILFLIRHGQTVANLEGFYSGQSDVKLTALGKAQAEGIRPILEKYTFENVDNAWTKVCYYYDYLGPNG